MKFSSRLLLLAFAFSLAAITSSAAFAYTAGPMPSYSAAVKRFRLVGHAMNGARSYLYVTKSGWIQSTSDRKKAVQVTLKNGSFLIGSSNAIKFRFAGKSIRGFQGSASSLGPQRFAVDLSGYVRYQSPFGNCLGINQGSLVIDRCRRSLVPLHYEQF